MRHRGFRAPAARIVLFSRGGGGMTCREVTDFLDRYLAGELPAPARKEFEAHIAGCAACAAYIRSYQRTLDLAKEAFDDADLDEIPDELVDAILAARKRKDA
jgi:anti-sigma factor RsiW